MHRRGLKWPAAGTVGLALVVLGVHLAWERHRYRLETPRGTVRLGMTRSEVEAVFGPAPFKAEPPHRPLHTEARRLGGGLVEVVYDDRDEVAEAWFRSADEVVTIIPRPSLADHVRSWFTSEGEE